MESNMNRSTFSAPSSWESQPQLHDQLTTAVLVSSLAVIGAISVTLYSLFASPLKHIPGPFLAQFTNLWRLLSVLSRHAEKKQREYHDRMGPAVRLGPNMVSISDPSMINQIYSRKNVLLKSDFYAVNDLNVNGRRVPNVFSTRDEHMNTQVMKPIVKLFSMGSLLSMEPLIDNTITYFIRRLEEEFVSTGNACDMASWLHYCAWDVIGDITFSQRMGFLKEGRDISGMCKMGYDAMDYFSAIGMMPWLDLFLDKNPVKRIGPPFFVPAVEFSVKRIQDRRSGADGHDHTSTPDLLDGFLDAQKENPDVVNEDIVLSYTMANVAAGSDTVATELRSILYHLCRDRSAMTRLRAELDGDNASVPLSWAQVQKLPFLCACVEEGIRLMPGISLPLERVVGKGGLTLADGQTFLPSGTVVGISPWVVNRDQDVFGVEPHQFHPERWLAATGEPDAVYKERLTNMRNSDLTFGAGKRQCAGRSLALLECHKIIGTLVRVFDIELADPEREWTTCNSWFMRQTDMDMRLRKRART